MSTTMIMESSTTSNRRQPTRQARTNPPRSSTQLVTSAPALIIQEAPSPPEPGFFPAITHFTDAISALPREMIRSFTMLKEVDAKIYGPEERLASLLNAGLKTSLPKANQAIKSSEPLPPAGDPDYNHPRFARQRAFRDLREELKGILQTQDEKNHVLYTTTDSLEKQLKRCQSSYQYIQNEVSEEARLGSMTHWAYSTEKAVEKKSMIGSERTRRANHLAAEIESGLGRGDARRETATGRKGRNQYIDSDFDDPRTHGKKAHNSGRSRKGEAVYGLGITNSGPASKRRKVEQIAMGGVAMGRSVSSAYGSNARGASPAIDSRKKPRATAAAANGRKRGGTLDSPHMASSPILGTFTTGGSKAHQAAGSPAPPSMQRVPSSRGKQVVAQSNAPNASTAASVPRNRSISTANSRAPNGGLDHERPTSLVNQKPGSTTSIKEALQNDANGGASERSRDNNSNATSRIRGDRPPSISVRGNGNGNGRNGSTSHGAPTSRNASKNATPLAASFDNPPTRPKRDPPHNKRSHKKGAAAAARMEWDAHNGDEEGEGEDADEEEEAVDTRRYCYCNEVSHGQMVACDSDDCEREWFHLHCIGLTRPPKAEDNWYCDECKEKRAKAWAARR